MRFTILKTLTFLLPLRTLTRLRPLPITSNSLRTMSSGSNQRMFQLRLDPLTGNSDWVVIDEDDDDDPLAEMGPKQPLLATTSYLDMLNDSRRSRAFRQAIDKTVTKPCHVLDIGAGTGLLSMMAARAMASDDTTRSSYEGRITSCESYLPMVKLMRKVFRLNGMEGKVRVINKRSDELEVGMDMTSRADVLVSEILDSELLGEGLIPTLQHAHDKLLVKNPRTVPYRATTYGQLVESPDLSKLHDLYSNEEKVLDDIHLVPAGMETILCVKPEQYSMHCNAMKGKMKLLSEPFKIFEFDFWRRPESLGKADLHIKAINDGTVHAVVSWWILQLDSEGTIFYSTSPNWICLPFDMKDLDSSLPSAGDWCDHWKQCVWFIPRKGLSVSKDEEIRLYASHSDISVSYDLKKQAWGSEIGQDDFCGQDCHLFLSPEKIAIYGDCSWRCSMLGAIKSALQQKVCSLCVVADDSLFLTVAVAHLSKTSHILSLFPGLRQKGAQYLQAVAVANGYSMDRVEVLDKRKANLTMHDTHHKKVDLLIAEPFYYGNENMLPWQNLRFWKQRTMLDQILSNDALIMPCKGILKACAMSFPDLWKSRRSLKEIEGFDHSVVNTTLGACGDFPAQVESSCLPFFVWQCGEIKELSERFYVMDFDFTKPIGPCSGNAQVKFKEPGICHGFALWIDWVMDAENSIVLSTGPDQRYWKQGVKFLTNSVAVGIPESGLGECCSADIEASFDPSNGELNVKYAFF